jgi:hypothetical protein
MDHDLKLPLQQTQLGTCGGVLDVEGGQQVRLFAVNAGDAGDRHALVDGEALTLDATQLVHDGLGRSGMPNELQALARHAVQDQGRGADASVGADMLRQTVEHQRDLDLGFLHIQAVLDVGEALVTLHDSPGLEIGHVGHQEHLAVHRLGALQSHLGDVIGEEIGLRVDFDDLAQMRLGHRVEEAGLDTRVAERAAAMNDVDTLPIQHAGEVLGSGAHGFDAIGPKGDLFLSTHGVVGHDQPVTHSAGLGDALSLCSGPIMEGLQQLDEVLIAPPRHDQRELERQAAVQGDAGNVSHIVHREQSTVGHHHQALHVRVAREHHPRRGLHRGGAGGGPVEHLVVDRRVVRDLAYPEHELPGHYPVLGHADDVTDIAVEHAQALAEGGGAVEEHQRESLIVQRATPVDQTVVDGTLVVHQRVHTGQQVLVGDLRRINAGHADSLQPAQSAELEAAIAKAVEDHHTNGLLHWDGEACLAKDPCQRLKPQINPELIQLPHFAHSRSRLEQHLRRGLVAAAVAPSHEQRLRELFDKALAAVHAPEHEQDAPAGPTICASGRGLHDHRADLAGRAGELDKPPG